MKKAGIDRKEKTENNEGDLDNSTDESEKESEPTTLKEIVLANKKILEKQNEAQTKQSKVKKALIEENEETDDFLKIVHKDVFNCLEEATAEVCFYKKNFKVTFLSCLKFVFLS